MRNELLARMGALFAEEKAQTGDESVALERTKARFDPAEITREFQESVPRLARWSIQFFEGFGYRQGESTYRHAARAAFRMTLLITLIMVPGVVPFVLFVWRQGPTTPTEIGKPPVPVTFFAALYVIVYLAVFLGIVLMHSAWRAWRESGRRFWWRVIAFSMCSSFFSCVLAFVLCLSATADLASSLANTVELVPLVSVLPAAVLLFSARVRQSLFQTTVQDHSWRRALIIDITWCLTAMAITWILGLALINDSHFRADNVAFVGIFLGLLSLLDVLLQRPRARAVMCPDLEWESLPIDARSA
jgi:hypothetical protein